ncbi:dihydroorotase [Halobacteriovorax sp. HLS]|uniref:dihydroorotase n=1 Tax=Halobacteriovorax sp. HLS TaxID=2234000 RepID=UPI000FDA815E|nr:dihydroorotase [Halobacteriovorax sp. HLS]
MEKFDLIVRNGNCILDTGIFVKDIGISKGKIVSIADQIKEGAHQEIDASGKHVFPGIIDTQVHFREPGLTHKEDLESGSSAAVLGGVTTFLEMPNTNPATTTKKAIEEKIALAQSKSHANFGFFMGATSDNLEELKKISEIKGCCGIKIFLGSSTGNLLLFEKGPIEEIFKNTKGIIALHSENEEMLVSNSSIRDNAASAHDHPKWRNVETALSSTLRIIQIAKQCNRKVHVLHITTQEEIEFLKNNKDICTVEVTPQHLTLSAPQCYDKLGTYAQMNPPIREVHHREALWVGLKDGTVDVIGSDHAPHTKEEKDKGYPNSPSGMPGVQTIFPVLLHHYANKRLTLDEIVKFMCVNPAKLYGLNKGHIKEEYDADLTIVDLEKEVEIQDQEMLSKCGWTPFNGMKYHGEISHTIVMGKVAMQNGKINKSVLGLPVEVNKRL